MASEQSESSSGHATHRPRDETTIGSGKFSVEAEIEREEEDYDTDLENVDYESFVNGKSLRKDLTSLKESAVHSAIEVYGLLRSHPKYEK